MSASSSTATTTPAPPKSFAEAFPESEVIPLIQPVEASAPLENPKPAENVVVFTADGKYKALLDRQNLVRFVASFRIMSESLQSANTTQEDGSSSSSSATSPGALHEWKLADAITANRENLSYFASWINYYSVKTSRDHVYKRSPSCITYPIFLGPPDYVLEPADFFFIENVILEKKGLGEKRIMKLISLGEFCAAIDCGVFRDIVSGYIAAKIREADEAFLEGLGDSADVVVRGWFGKTGGLSDEEFNAAAQKFGGTPDEQQKKRGVPEKIIFGKDWQEHDRSARAAQKAAGILPLQPYE